MKRLSFSNQTPIPFKKRVVETDDHKVKAIPSDVQSVSTSQIETYMSFHSETLEPSDLQSLQCFSPPPSFAKNLKKEDEVSVFPVDRLHNRLEKSLRNSFSMQSSFKPRGGELPVQWSVDQVGQWMQTIKKGISQSDITSCWRLFRKHDINGERLVQLNSINLHQLQIPHHIHQPLLDAIRSLPMEPLDIEDSSEDDEKNSNGHTGPNDSKEAASFMAGVLEEITVNVLEVAGFLANQRHTSSHDGQGICIQEHHVAAALNSDGALSSLKQRIFLGRNNEHAKIKQIRRPSENFVALPSQVTRCIFDFFLGDLPMLGNLSRVCKKLYDVTGTKELWRPIHTQANILSTEVMNVRCFREFLASKKIVAVGEERWMLFDHPAIEEYSRQMVINRNQQLDRIGDYSCSFFIRLNEVFDFGKILLNRDSHDVRILMSLQQLVDEFGARCGPFNASQVWTNAEVLTQVQGREGIESMFATTQTLDIFPVYDDWKEELQTIVAKLTEVEESTTLSKCL